MAVTRKVSPPNLPTSPPQYATTWQEQYSNVLRLFFNQLTNVVNAATPYGSFYDTSNQTNPGASVPQTIHLSNTASAYKTSVTDGTAVNAKVFVAESGIYNIQFSAQVQKGSGGGSSTDVYFWLRQNGVDIKDSGGVCTLGNSASGSRLVTSWNYVLPLQAGDYVQLAWTSSDTSVTLPYIAATATIPASPSVIFTINWVSSIPL
jgi:hypothetical protein